MRLPTTMKGYISMFNKIETVFMPTLLKGFEDLPEELKLKIQDFDAIISNEFGELEAEYYEWLKINEKKYET